MSSVFYGYEPYKGDIPKRATGSLVAFETGTAVTYGLYNAQERGTLFIGAGVDVYEGMIVGQSPKDEDIVVNVCKKKHMTNTRASGSVGCVASDSTEGDEPGAGNRVHRRG